jgi:hypothetical protein
MCRCCWDWQPEFALRERAYAPPWAGRWWGQGGPRFGWPDAGPTKTERKEWLEALKKHLEERVADINEELSKV